MEAPRAGLGLYSVDEIRFILQTAHAGFRAARLESQRLFPARKRVAVHTGFWGCGAYGGNRVLMTLLQSIAAAMAGVDRLVFHTVESSGTAAFQSAQDLLLQLLPDRAGTVDTEETIEEIQALGLSWGVSDGN
jgi:hypothetical protein